MITCECFARRSMSVVKFDTGVRTVADQFYLFLFASIEIGRPGGDDVVAILIVGASGAAVGCAMRREGLHVGDGFGLRHDSNSPADARFPVEVRIDGADGLLSSRRFDARRDRVDVGFVRGRSCRELVIAGGHSVEWSRGNRSALRGRSLACWKAISKAPSMFAGEYVGHCSSPRSPRSFHAGGVGCWPTVSVARTLAGVGRRGCR